MYHIQSNVDLSSQPSQSTFKALGFLMIKQEAKSV